MRRPRILLVAAATALLVVLSAAAQRTLGQTQTFADADARSIALFREAGKVLLNPRCLNCHPVDDRPTQTDRMEPHRPWVVRGVDGNGAPGLACGTCHHAANFDAAGVPGNPGWRLAPASMGWQGRSLGAICAQIKDPARNGGQGHGCTAPPRLGRQPGGLGLDARRQTHARAWDSGRVRRADAGLGRQRRGLPAGQSGSRNQNPSPAG